jgi:D-glycero-beta-D-manno-heptose 1-phosphate adenylyltransferase
MKTNQALQHKIYTLDNLQRQANIWRMLGKKIVFTNGVFDVLHKGHIASLTEAATHGDILVVGVNADASVQKLKGPTRPINDEAARTLLLASLLQTDAIIIFEEDTPLNLITTIMPDVLVKGGDYTIDQIVGSKEVLAAGGKVVIAKIVDGVSSSIIIDKLGLGV